VISRAGNREPERRKQEVKTRKDHRADTIHRLTGSVAKQILVFKQLQEVSEHDFSTFLGRIEQDFRDILNDTEGKDPRTGAPFKRQTLYERGMVL
jgi:hypothetical protein